MMINENTQIRAYRQQMSDLSYSITRLMRESKKTGVAVRHYHAVLNRLVEVQQLLERIEKL